MAQGSGRAARFLGEATAAARAIARDPREGLTRVVERAAERRERREERPAYQADPDGERRLHELLGLPWPCEARAELDAVWEAATQELRARGLAVGRGTYGEWDDGDVRLAALAWCATRHLRPAVAIETGVARGLTTRVILEAMERNGQGRLWSIDLPPMVVGGLESELAAAVPEGMRGRWRLVRGSSRRRLPGVLADVGAVDLFVHDSMHSTRNTRFELERVWPALRPGGVAFVDDVEKNAAMAGFLRAHPGTPAVITPAADGAVLIGCLVKPAAG